MTDCILERPTSKVKETPPKHRRRRRSGFTIVESIYPISIIALIAGTIVPILTIRGPEFYSHSDIISSLESLQEAYDRHEMTTGRLPAELNELEEYVLAGADVFFDPETGVYQHQIWDYCFEGEVKGQKKFKIIARPCGEKRHGSKIFCIAETGEVEELATDPNAELERRLREKQAIADGYRDMGLTLLDAGSNRDEAIDSVLSDALSQTVFQLYQAFDADGDGSLAIRELKQFAMEDSQDQPIVVRAKTLMRDQLEQLALPDDVELKIADLTRNPDEFISPTNFGTYIELLDAPRFAVRSIGGTVRSIELLVRYRLHGLAQLMWGVADFQVTLFTGWAIDRDDAEISHVLIELLVRKSELAAGF